jgi:hypothetical protein
MRGVDPAFEFPATRLSDLPEIHILLKQWPPHSFRKIVTPKKHHKDVRNTHAIAMVEYAQSKLLFVSRHEKSFHKVIIAITCVNKRQHTRSLFWFLLLD